MDLLIFLAAGLTAGFAAGLLGSGGGTIVVPVLVLIFSLHGFSRALTMHMAIGTSLGIMIFTSISSVWAHNKQGGILWPVFKKMLPGLILGCIIGVSIAGFLPGQVLHLVFAIFVFLVAIQLGFDFHPKGQRQLPKTKGLFAMGTIVGSVAAILGIGGSVINVPFFRYCRVKMVNTIATAATCGLPIAVLGTIGFAYIGWDKPKLPPWSIGYVHMPALIGVAIGTMLFAPIGAKLAHKLPSKTLRIIYALVLVVIGIGMLVGKSG